MTADAVAARDGEVMFHNRPTVTVASPRGAWGLYERSVGRYGLISERLRVLPPDTTDHERRVWSALRIWPVVGFLIAIAVALMTDPLLGSFAALLAAAVLWLGPLLWLWKTARPFVGRIHEAWAGRSIVGIEDVDRTRLRRVAAELAVAESWFHAGRLDEGQFARCGRTRIGR